MEKKKTGLDTGKFTICQTCHQDMAELPRKGINDKNCPQCGQGINWKKAMMNKKAKNKKVK